MPELPEVETIVRDLSSAITNQTVINAKFRNTQIRETGDYKTASVLRGKKLKKISRRGKNIIFHFSKNLAIVCHLKMTGRLIINSNSDFDKKHLHFFIDFNKSRLDFYDVRKFGRICIVKEQNLQCHQRLKKLGPEPFGIKSEEFADRHKSRNRAIKTVLLDQEVVAGLGNIYADESLFEAGIRPTLKASKISKARLMKLHESVVMVLNKAINHRGTSVDDYLDGFGQSGNFQKLIKVYGKTGQACPICKTKIRRIVLGGRSTHYCPKCQR